MKQNFDKSTSSGGGMSRAAKKRAKKKKKQSETKQPTLYDNDDGSNTNRLDETKNNDSLLVAKKKRKTDAEGASLITKWDGTDEDKEFTSAKEFSKPTQGEVFYPDVSISEVLKLRESQNTERLEGMTSTQRAACLLQAILSPVSLEEFYNEYFEKKPLVVTASSKKVRSTYSDLLSLESIKALTKKHSMYYGRDLNVTKYRKGRDGVKRRITLDKIADGDEYDEESKGVLVENSELWSNYNDGCTIRLLCPHKYSDAIQSLISTLELEFHCMVGANAYLTPPRSSQGFAPHYDDIDAYCLQLQGSKRWKVYEPTVELPRTSSEDFTPEDLEGMKPVLDVTLEEGDLLYMPRYET